MIISGRLPSVQILVWIDTVGTSPQIGNYNLCCPFPRSCAQFEPLHRSAHFLAQNGVFPQTDGHDKWCHVGAYSRHFGGGIWGKYTPNPSHKNGVNRQSQAKTPRSVEQELGRCWDVRAILHNSNFRCQVWIPLFNELVSNLCECHYKSQGPILPKTRLYWLHIYCRQTESV